MNLEDIFAGLSRPSHLCSGHNNTYNLRHDVLEFPDRVEVYVDLPPGAHTSVEILDRELTLTVERNLKHAEGATYLREERFTGKVVGTFHIGEGLLTDQVNAEEREGVLIVTIPREPQKVPRKIPVTGDAQGPPGE